MIKRKYSMLIAFCLLSLFCAWGQEEVLNQEALTERYGGRIALVGQHCIVNQISTVANLLTNYDHLEYVTDEDLNNFATITAGVNAGVAVLPFFSVKDTKHTYAAGTKAGFTLVSTEGGGLLSLNVIKLFSIGVYNDGKLMETLKVEEGQGTGVGLELIKIPNSDDISVDLTVTPTYNFDELYLEYNGVNVYALQEFSIKYAFVGEAVEYPIVFEDNFEKNNKEYVIEDLDNSVLLDECEGMPWPVGHEWWWVGDTDLAHNFFDRNTENKLTTGALAIGEWFHVQIGFKESFEAGTEIGFKTSNKGLLDLSLGGFVTIDLYKDGKKIQTARIEASVLGLGIGNNGDSKNSVIAEQPFDKVRYTLGAGALAANLGEIAVYYSFIKKKPGVEHHCPINANISSRICEGETTYQLEWNKDIDVTWSVQERPEGSNVQVDKETGAVINIDHNGEYVFKATATDGCTETVTLTKGKTFGSENSCGTPIINTAGEAPVYAISSKRHESSGSLLNISSLKNSSNVLDGDLNNYLEYVSGVSVVDNMGIIGIKTVDGSSFNDRFSEIKGDKRVGFIVENTSTFLDAKVLEFFQIRLYKNGVRVEDVPLVIDESNTVSVGLIGEERSQKVRFSIKVPAHVDFDEFQLWKSGVLDLGLSTLRVYYGFIESADENCSDPISSSCALTVSSSSEEVNATFVPQIPFQTASVVSVLKDADYLIDDDMETALNYVNTIEVGSGIILCVKLGRVIDDRQQFGVVVDNETYLAGVGVGTWMTVSTYLNGKPTGDEFTNWGTVGLDVIGYGDKKYLISNPTTAYDEVRLTLAGIASLLNGYKIYGLFLRSDLDRDGLPDCLDPDTCEGELSGMSVTNDICEGEYVMLSGLVRFETDESSKKYRIEWKGTASDGTAVTGTEDIEAVKEGTANEQILSWTHLMEKAGQYELNVYKFDENEQVETVPIYSLDFFVHPLVTTWKTGSATADWNTWENWTNGSPLACTDVIIPSPSNGRNDMYPILTTDKSNACHYIHFKSNAEVVNTHYLTYEKAWVEMSLKSDRYYMVSVPLKEIRSGDFFYPKTGTDYPEYFTELNESSLPANRVTPTVYQRMWESVAYDRLITGGRDLVYPGTTRWTTPSNMLAAYYDLNDGFGLSLWVNPDGPKENNEPVDTYYTFRFPKTHEKYFYYDADGQVLDVSEQMKRDVASIGRFIYEDANRQVDFPVRVKVKNADYSNKTFLIGNPFMSHIDVVKFMEENEVLSIKVYDGTGSNSLIADVEGGFLSTSDNTNSLSLIAPTQAFFVTIADDGLETDECEVSFTEAMLTSGKGQSLLRSAEPESESEKIQLRVRNEQSKAQALISFSSKASDSFSEREDSEVLLDESTPSLLSLFSVVGEKALDIQQRAHGGKIPLGLYLSREGDITLSVVMPDNYEGWSLVDQASGKRYPLIAGKTNEILLEDVTTNVGRFYLQGNLLTSADAIVAVPSGVYAYQESDDIVVRCENGMLTRCELYMVDGRLSSLANFQSNEYRFLKGKGIYIIKAYYEDGRFETLKLISR